VHLPSFEKSNPLRVPAIFGIIFLLATSANAQSSTSEIFISISSPILDNGLGFDLGLRSSLLQGENLSLMGQIGFGQYSVSEFLSGRITKGNYSGLMIGPSITFLRESKLKPTFLLLGGVQAHYQKREGVGNSLDFGIGASAELNVSISNRLKLGAFAHSPGFVGLRCSYII
jgi:hypothetical protein